MQNQFIYQKPILDLIDKVNNKDFNSLLMLGKIGSGKTLVMNNLLKYPNTFNGTVYYEERRNFINNKINNLYYIVILLYKVVNNLINNYNDLKITLALYLKKIIYIKEILDIGYLTRCNIAYFYTKPNIDNKYINNPYLLIDELKEALKDKLCLNNLIITLDDYDDLNKNIYNNLEKYFKVIYFVSDIEKVNIQSESLKIDYSEDVDVITEILDKYLISDNFINKDNMHMRIRFILNNEDIANLISATNGNIFLMKHIVYKFYSIIRDIKYLNPAYKFDYLIYKKLFNDAIKTELVEYKKLKRTLSF